MKNIRYSIVHWILVTTMVVMPLRTALAFEQSSCHDQDRTVQHAVEQIMHHGHAMMDAERSHGVAAVDCCCCEADEACHADCGISLSVNVIMPQALTMSAADAVSLRAQLDTILILRESGPPIRPPRYL